MGPEVDSLIAAARADGLVLRRLFVPDEDVVFVKTVLEAYPGLGILLAPSGPVPDARPGQSTLTVMGARGKDAELDDLLAELAPPGGTPLEGPP
jgi:hypothetical protein